MQSLLLTTTDIPLDQFIATALAEKVAVLDADSYIRERAERGSREKFEAVLSRFRTSNPKRMTVFRLTTRDS